MGATLEFFHGTGEGAVPALNALQGPTGVSYTVTPENEAFIRCTSSDGRRTSEFVAIAGKLARA